MREKRTNSTYLFKSPNHVGNAVRRKYCSTERSRIDHFPSTILNHTTLTDLDLSGNMLTGSLPAEIRQLSRLRTLHISKNRFTGLPAEMGQLQALEVFDTSYNQLTGLPHELGNLTNLKRLILTGNIFSQQDLAVILKTLPNVAVER
jgi:Leucine-rich repeat (LRR) protein